MGLSAAQLLEARDRLLPDVLAPGLSVVFVGINPGLYSAAVGYHFARPGNRFWPTLFRSGFTPHLMKPSEQFDLLPLGIGLTNIVSRATARADELTEEEIRAGARTLSEKVLRYRPRAIAVLGLSVYRIAFQSPEADLGPQPHPPDLSFGDAKIHLLPNPSGLNAHYPINDLAKLFADFRLSLE